MVSAASWPRTSARRCGRRSIFEPITIHGNLAGFALHLNPLPGAEADELIAGQILRGAKSRLLGAARIEFQELVRFVPEHGFRFGDVVRNCRFILAKELLVTALIGIPTCKKRNMALAALGIDGLRI